MRYGDTLYLPVKFVAGNQRHKEVIYMAINAGPGKGRVGAVRRRRQYLNPKTKRWVKIDADTGLFIDVKSDGTPFKGVSKPKKAA